MVKPLLVSYPADPELLILAALAALLEDRPDQSLTYQKRLKRRYVPSHAGHLLHALAMAQKRMWPQAARIVDQYFFSDFGISRWLVLLAMRRRAQAVGQAMAQSN